MPLLATADIGAMPEEEMTDWFQKEHLQIAADKGDLDRVKALVESGYDVNAFDDGLSLTALHYAARAENIEVMKYLLSVGADVNAHEEDKIGETPQRNITVRHNKKIEPE